MDTMPTATPAQETAYSALCEALHHIEHTLHELERARDALNRETPAREVAIAITEVEGGQLRVEKALRVLTGSVVFTLAESPQGERTYPSEPYPEGTSLGDGPQSMKPRSVVRGDYDRPTR